MIKKALLNIYFWPLFLLVTLIAFAVSPFLFVGNLLVFRIPTDILIRKSIRIYGWFLVRVVPFMAPVTVEDRSGGLDEPVIFVPNHCSSIDPYLFGMLPVDNAFVTSWPFRIPVYNFFMHLAGYINSNLGWDHVHQRGSQLLDSGCSLIIWPEGHRSRDGKLQRFMNGAFQLSLASKRPIIPVCVVGSRLMLPPGKRFLTPSRIKMIILPGVNPDGDSNNPDDVKRMKETVKKIIATELDNQKNPSELRQSSAAASTNAQKNDEVPLKEATL